MKPLVLLLALLAPAAAPAEPIEWTVGPAGGGGGRVLFAPDPMLLALARDPDLDPGFTDHATAGDDGKVSHPLLENGWAHRAIHADAARTVIVSGRGFAGLFLNGERHAGDPYRDGFVRFPLRLRAGENSLLVRAVRGGFTLHLAPAEGPASVSAADAIVPDFRDGERIDEPGAVVVLNHEGEPLRGAVLEVGDGAVTERVLIPLTPVLPYGVSKPGFPVRQIRAPRESELDDKGRYRLPVVLRRGAFAVATEVPFEVRGPGDAYRQTRRSGIDGSVQYHAVRRPISVEPGRKYALWLTLHGAGVEAIGQARAYAPKRDGFVIAPTNRRRFGFDWQEWGRRDMLEVLEYALARYPIDPDRVYLTGHSMGGHGTWYLGTMFATRFAAIAPSAGWASFFTYAGGLPRDFGSDPDLDPFERALAVNDTEAFLTNLAATPVYVLHGELDDNVPLRESENLLRRLREFHRDFDFHVEPGAGHWWGNRCVDYDPLLEFCRRHVRVPAPLEIRFSTPDLAVTDRAAWVRILSVTEPGLPAAVRAEADPRTGTVAIETENVAGLALELGAVAPGDAVTVTADGHPIETAGGDVRLRRDDGAWTQGDPVVKGGGPVKECFANRMVFVYGTCGTPEENAATLAGVRYDVETWWVRGNGSVPVVADRDFDAERYAGRNVIVYGNRATNSAYAALLPDSPVSIDRGRVVVRGRTYEDELGLYLCRPRSDGDGMVVVIGGTTAAATRMLQQARYFVSGVVCPDFVVFTEDTLTRGMEGVATSGFFGNDWR